MDRGATHTHTHARTHACVYSLFQLIEIFPM